MDVLTWSYWVDTKIGGVHFGAALICLALGPYIFSRRKGDKIHRISGRVWALLMFALNITALSSYDISGRPTLFHFFALLSLATLTPGVIMIWVYKRSRKRTHLIVHQMCMIWAYFGLAAAGVWQIGLRLLVHYMGPESYGIGLGMFGGLTFVCAGVLNIYLNRKLSVGS